MKHIWYRFLFIMCVGSALAGAPAAQAAAPQPTGVFLYMVDMTNSMAGCPNCLGRPKSDNVMPQVMARIAREVEAAAGSLEVYVVPFTRAVLDFDGKGAFDPWRKFSIRNTKDAKAFADYLDPERFGLTGVDVDRRFLPDFGPPESPGPWPGFSKLCAENLYVDTALYGAMIRGLDFLRDRVPSGKEEQQAYLASHWHRMTVFTDGINAVKIANFAHVVQATELHRSEMDGRFWLTKVYVEGATPDARLDEENKNEREIAANTQGIYITKLKDLQPASEMISLSVNRVAYTGGLKNPADYADGVMTIPFPAVKIFGVATRIWASVEESIFSQWPEGAGFQVAKTPLLSPFDNISEAFSGTLTGVPKVLDAGLTRTTVTLKLRVEGDKTSKRPLFLMSGAPDFFIDFELDLTPPRGTISVAITPPGGGGASSLGPQSWDMGRRPLREIRAGDLEEGTINLSGDSNILPGASVKLVFDPEVLRITAASGEEMFNGKMVRISPLKISLIAPAEPGRISTEFGFDSLSPNIVFDGGASEFRAKIQIEVASDLPFYLGVAVGVAVALILLGLVLYKTLMAPPKMSTVGGRLVMVRSPEGAVEEERNLAQWEKNLFTAGAGQSCDWVLAGGTAPFVAFEIELRRGEGKLRIRKKDLEVEDVKLNGKDMAETFLKDGDRIELIDFEFVFHRV